MKYRTLGRTGIQVSPYCLGTMMFGAMGNSDHDDSIRIIHNALDAGINFVDTADAYSRGESEENVGKALKDRRDNVVLASKAFLPMSDDPNHRGSSRRPPCSSSPTSEPHSPRRMGLAVGPIFDRNLRPNASTCSTNASPP
jgi:aryl-alcohol dehydrogenase-like predicted oxidoreductase